MNVKFSVVCPTYNCESFIENTLRSVSEQTLAPDEILIVDDGSTDRTCHIVEEFIKKWTGGNIRLFKCEHKGSAGYARNYAIKHSRNEWIAFIDADDSWESKKLERVARSIKSNPEGNFFCHSEHHKTKGGNGVLEYYRKFDKSKSLIPQLYWRNLFSTSAVVCKRDILEKAGLFKEDLYSAQDYEMWLRMSPWIRVVFIEDVLGTYYDRDGNISSAKLNHRYQDVVSVLNIHKDKVTFGEYALRLAKINLAFGRDYIKKQVLR